MTHRLVSCIGAAIVTCGVLGTAVANGRFPATVDVKFQPGDNQRILVPVTFGLLLSDDGGASFQWVCEQAIGYGGMFDPDYAITATGTIFASTFDGLRVTRDGGCTWNTQSGALAQHVIAAVEADADGQVWVSTQSIDQGNDVYVSADDGMTFQPTGLVHPTAWWRSLQAAPGDTPRKYDSGFVPAVFGPDGGVTDAEALLYRTDDGGQTWIELSVAQFEFNRSPNLAIAAVAPDNPDVVFARSINGVDPIGDILYRSTDAGQTWAEIQPAGARFTEAVTAFLARPGGEVFAAGLETGVFRSTDGGNTWSRTTEQPVMSCLTERPDGELFACGSNFPPDCFAIGESSDGQTWDKVMRLSELVAPLSCPESTVQFQTCEVQLFPSLCEQLGCNRPPAPGAVCGGGVEPDAGVDPDPAPAGCCDAGVDPRGTALIALFAALALALVMPRRRRG